MEFLGTKGPWRVIEGWNKKGEGKFFPSVVLFGPDDDGSLGRNRITINVSHNQQVESLMANALLISKAPQMLEMLKRVLRLNNSAKEHICEKLFSDIEQLIKESTKI